MGKKIHTNDVNEHTQLGNPILSEALLKGFENMPTKTYEPVKLFAPERIKEEEEKVQEKVTDYAERGHKLPKDIEKEIESKIPKEKKVQPQPEPTSIFGNTFKQNFTKDNAIFDAPVVEPTTDEPNALDPPPLYSDEGGSYGNEAAPDTEKIARRRRLWSTYGMKLYDELQASLSIIGWDRINTPSDLITRRKELREISYDNKLTSDESKELRTLDTIIDGFHERRISFTDNVKMSDDLRNDAAEMIEQVLEIEGYDPNPLHILCGILAVQPVTNLVAIFMERITHKSTY